jgi:hypothetical protein
MFIEFENEIMLKIIKENNLYHKKLLNQYKISSVVSREFTNHGFYTNYIIENQSSCVGENINIVIGNIRAKLNDMERGAGFALYIKKGFISFLEGYSYGELFPEKIYKYELFDNISD